jgi:hypothetical protein
MWNYVATLLKVSNVIVAHSSGIATQRSFTDAVQATEADVSNPDDAILKMTPGLRTENVCCSDSLYAAYTYRGGAKGDYIPIAKLKKEGKANIIAVAVSVQELKLARTGGMFE